MIVDEELGEEPLPKNLCRGRTLTSYVERLRLESSSKYTTTPTNQPPRHPAYHPFGTASKQDSLLNNARLLN